MIKFGVKKNQTSCYKLGSSYLHGLAAVRPAAVLLSVDWAAVAVDVLHPYRLQGAAVRDGDAPDAPARTVVPRAPAVASPRPDPDDLARRDHPPVVTARLLLRKLKARVVHSEI